MSERRANGSDDRPGWLRRQLSRLLGRRAKGDVIAASVDEGARGVAVGKNIIQIGTVVIPTLTVLILLLPLLILLGFVGFRMLRGPEPGPAQMSGEFNVAVANFGATDAEGRVRSSDDGRRLSQWVFEALQREYQQFPDPSIGGIQLWHDSLDRSVKGQTIGTISGPTPETRRDAAAQVADAIRADVLIYGHLDASASPAGSVVEFYVSLRLRGEVDLTFGRYQLGDPIPVQLPIDLGDPIARAALSRDLTTRTRALFWLILGLREDLLGRPEAALEVLRQAESQLTDWEERGEGKEILYFFIGRAALFAGRDAEAEAAFNSAVESNPDYARAWSGLGSVYYSRAQDLQLGREPVAAGDDTTPLTPEERTRLVQENREKAIQNYEKAIALAEASPEPQVANIARYGLGISAASQGVTHREQENYEEAVRAFQLAAREIEAILTPLAELEQHRLLGQAYSALGGVYAQQAWLQRQVQGDAQASIALYERAHQAYLDCMAQQAGAPFDEILTERVIPGCESRDQEVGSALSELRGEP